MKADIKDLLLNNIDSSDEITDSGELYDHLDYAGGLHEIIDSNIDIFVCYKSQLVLEEIPYYLASKNPARRMHSCKINCSFSFSKLNVSLVSPFIHFGIFLKGGESLFKSFVVNIILTRPGILVKNFFILHRYN